MKSSKKKKEVFYIICPCCHSELWIDPMTRQVIQSEKSGKKKKGSLHELLSKEKERRDGYDRKFEATAELERQKWKKTQEKFKKAFTELDKED